MADRLRLVSAKVAASFHLDSAASGALVKREGRNKQPSLRGAFAAFIHHRSLLGRCGLKWNKTFQHGEARHRNFCSACLSGKNTPAEESQVTSCVLLRCFRTCREGLGSAQGERHLTVLAHVTASGDEL